jgi:hypothetical protein
VIEVEDRGPGVPVSERRPSSVRSAVGATSTPRRGCRSGLALHTWATARAAGPPSSAETPGVPRLEIDLLPSGRAAPRGFAHIP